MTSASKTNENYMTSTSPAIPLWINGKKVSATSQRFADVTNPATGAVIRKVPLANSEDIANAVAAARAWLRVFGN